MATSDQVGSEEAAQMVEPEVRENSLRSGTENKTDISPANDLHSHRNDPVKQAENSESQIDADPESLEEGELTWESCTCSNASCLSCRAEKVAIMTWSKPSDTQRVSQCTEGFSHNCDDKRKVCLGSPTRDTTAHIFTYNFHKSISDSSLQCAASPSALSTLLFAKSFLADPDELTDCEASDKLYNQVVGAIEKAITIHKDKFDSDPVTLTPGDACEMLASLGEGDFNVLSSETCTPESVLNGVVCEYAIQLQASQALLFSCQNPYVVFSIVNARDSEGVLAFHSQNRFTENISGKNGASLVYCVKDVQLLYSMMTVFHALACLPPNESYQLVVVDICVMDSSITNP